MEKPKINEFFIVSALWGIISYFILLRTRVRWLALWVSVC